jgi:predicted histone-like DNA-binding protein
MPIKYNVVEKPQPGVAGGGIKKWYASAKMDGELTIDELTKEIEKFSALSEADIRGVIIALENVIVNELGNGKIIRLDKLGSFYPSLSSEGEPLPKPNLTLL